MRISDWSSEVCSSDLRCFIDANIHQQHKQYKYHTVKVKLFFLSALMIFQYAANCQTTTVLSGSVHREDGQPVAGPRIRLLNTSLDRKSGLEGRSVTVWLDSGGILPSTQKKPWQ